MSGIYRVVLLSMLACILSCGHSKTLKKKNFEINILSQSIHSDGQCEAVCPKLLSPVCGSDGITYQSTCYLKCSNVLKQRKSPVTIEYHGHCESTEQEGFEYAAETKNPWEESCHVIKKTHPHCFIALHGNGNLNRQ